MNAKPLWRVQRAHTRYGLALPVTIEGEPGRTHDLSAQGVLLETRLRPRVGAEVALGLGVQGAGHPSLACDGRVVRVVAAGDAYNVAVKLSKPLFK